MGSLKCQIVHVGKSKRPYVQAGVEHFLKRIRPYASISLVAVKEEPNRKGITPEQILDRERERIQQRMEPGFLWIAMDRNGNHFDSETLASQMENWLSHGRSRLAFVIGGPHGLPPSVLREVDLALSLSPMTFSHELTLLVLLEQLYRSLAIMHHLPYPR